MTWHPCAAALPPPDADALVLTADGDVIRARVAWTGRAWRSAIPGGTLTY